MIGSRNKILIKRRSFGSSKNTLQILWPLVLYSLIQNAAKFLPQSNNLQDVETRINTCQTWSVTSPRELASVLVDTATQQQQQQDHHYSRQQDQAKSSCSSSSKISSPSSSVNLQTYLASLLRHVLNGGSGHASTILMVDALSLYQPNQDKGIMILNSTNFNSELIQHKHPFPHVKLIEYYVSYSSFGTKFKSTYTRLAKEIHPWRNVIRQSVIDLGVASNSPIANSWSIKIVPLLRIHPPPNPALADKLDKRLSEWSAHLSPSDLQKSMFDEYNSSRLMVEELDATRYLDQVSLLKSDLLDYIERYVVERPNDLPSTWPNLRPVTETTFTSLCRNHPHHELFLLIEGGDSKSDQSKMGLNLMMELSSSAPRKAIRYVRASENTALIENVIALQQQLQQQQQQQQQQQKRTSENVELLKDFLANKSTGGNNILLIHVDDSQSPARGGGAMSLVDLATMDQSVSLEQEGNYGARAKRSSEQLQLDKMSSERKIDLLSVYIKQNYIETKEDREFVEAINSFSNDNTAKLSRDATEKSTTTKSQHRYHIDKSNNQDSESIAQDQSSFLNKLLTTINPPSKIERLLQSNASVSSGDYDDKLKAIRYMFFNEVPRISMADRSLVEQQEKLNILINLVTVIKAYFPLPDSSSIKFMDGVHSYLTKQQSRLLSINNQEQKNAIGFDTRAFKQELKRLESEDKRLPEIKEWKHCQHFGYPCAVWRLFHTLVAFEYKKLSQIHQHQPASKPQPSKALSKSISPASSETIAMKSIESHGPQSPVEHLVSPPSTTTSLSLTIATPVSQRASTNGAASNNYYNNNNSDKPLTEADLPTPVILVMRDYITNFFSCEECKEQFRAEAADLSLEKIRQQEPAEFSILWLWETHNRVNKRLSVDPESNPPDHPKVWFPTFNQCNACYKKPPSFLRDPSVDSVTIFHESIEWNRQEVLNFLLCEFTKQPMDNYTNLFGYQVSYGYITIACAFCLILIVVLRCASYYVERQRRHKATLLNGNGNGAHYTLAVHG